MPRPDICIICKHYWGQGKCKAFPDGDGIPEEIFITGENDHSKPYPGDNGIRFEPIDETEETKEV